MHITSHYSPAILLFSVAYNTYKIKKLVINLYVLSHFSRVQLFVTHGL